MDNAGACSITATSDAGMGTLTRDGFEPALLDLIAPWLGPGNTPVIACGMVGSRQGWAEAPYRAVPCPAQSESLTRVAAEDRRLDVHIVPGVKQVSPADVMRGEETQIAGFLSQNPTSTASSACPAPTANGSMSAPARSSASAPS